MWFYIKFDLPSGKHTKNYGNSPFGIGKSTVNEPFWIAMLNYQRVCPAVFAFALDSLCFPFFSSVFWFFAFPLLYFSVSLLLDLRFWPSSLLSLLCSSVSALLLICIFPICLSAFASVFLSFCFHSFYLFGAFLKWWYSYGYKSCIFGGDHPWKIIQRDPVIPICSMVLEYLPTFGLKITQSCR